jgi:Acyl-CoA dehydrogenase, N-terminal domain
MTYAAGKAAPDDSPILHAAVALATQIREASDEIEQGRRIVPRIAAAMKEAGVFGMPMPRVWGGPELDPLSQFRVIEALAMADASVGWCAMIGCDGGYMTAFLDDAVGRAICSLLRLPLRRRPGRRGKHPVVTASMVDSHSSVVASTANGRGWAA